MTIIPGAQRRQLWGSLVSCGRLAIGLVRYPSQTAAVTNRRAGCHPAPHYLDNRQHSGRTTLDWLLAPRSFGTGIESDPHTDSRADSHPAAKGKTKSVLDCDFQVIE
jgi:hypothetical protein